VQLSPSVIAALGIVSVVVVLLVFRFRRSRSRRGSSSARGPSSLHFICAGCKGQFNHTKRTVSAWERGTRKFFCDACHKSWRQANPSSAPRAAPTGGAAQPRPRRGLAPARSGCLSVLVVVVLLPALLYAVARYA